MQQKLSLKRNFNLTSLIFLIIGSVVGSGIFIIPGFVSARISSPMLILLVWLISGLISLTLALHLVKFSIKTSFKEGLFGFFKNSLGEFSAYFYAWISLAILNTGMVAGIAYAFGNYASDYISIAASQKVTIKILAAGSILLFTILNYVSIVQAKNFQNLFGIIKVSVVVMLIGGLCYQIFWGPGNLTGHSEMQLFLGFEFEQFVIAIGISNWAYSGWINAFNMVEEIKNPQSIMHRGVLLSISIIITLYLLFNSALLIIMSPEQMAQSITVASDAYSSVWGGDGRKLVGICVVVFILGSLNGNTMATARLTQSMASEGLFFKWAGIIHRKWLTPGNAILTHGVWMIILIIFFSLSQLVFVTVIFSSFFAVLICIGLLRLELKENTTRSLGFYLKQIPLLVVLLISFLIFVFTCKYELKEVSNEQFQLAMLSIVLIVLGILLFPYFKRRI